jgi:hypothetical protein
MLSYLLGTSKANKTENEDPLVALKESIEAHKDFKSKIDGTLEFDDFLVLRSIIFRQCDRKFFPTKQMLRQR